MKRALLGLVICLGVGVLFVRSCSGPRPRLVSARMHGNVAVATVRNDGAGEGQIDVQFTVRGASGPPVVRNERATLGPHQEARIESRIDGARGDERVEAEVDYPPR
jgi:hypothetical protein